MRMTASVCLLVVIFLTAPAVAKNDVSIHGTTITVSIPIEVCILPHLQRRQKEYPQLPKSFKQLESDTRVWIERGERFLNTDTNREVNLLQKILDCYQVRFHFTVDLVTRWHPDGKPKWTAGKHRVLITRPPATSRWTTTPSGGDPYENDLTIVGSQNVFSKSFNDKLEKLAYYRGSGDLTMKRIKEILEERGEKLDACMDLDIEFDVLGFGSWHPPAPAEILRGPFGEPTHWVRLTNETEVSLVTADDGTLNGTGELRTWHESATTARTSDPIQTVAVSGKREGDRITLPWGPQVFQLDLVDGYYYGTRRGPQGGRFIIRVEKRQDAALGAAKAVDERAFFASSVQRLNRMRPSASVAFGLSRSAPALLTTALFAKNQGEVSPACCGNATTTKSIVELIAMLRSVDIFARRDAVRELGARGARATEAVPALIKVLKDKHDDRVPLYAAEALGCVGVDSDAARKALRDLVNTEDPLLRVVAAEALGRIAPDQDASLKTLMSVLTDSVLSERYPSATAAAIQSLGRMRERGRAAGQILKGIAKNERKVGLLRAEACLALWRVYQDAGSTLPVLSDLLGTTREEVDYVVLEKAAQVIAEMGPAAKRILPALVAQLDRPQVSPAQPPAPKVSDEVIAQMVKQLANAPPQLKASLERALTQLKAQRSAKSTIKETNADDLPPAYLDFLDAGFDAVIKAGQENAAIHLVKLLRAEDLTIRHHAIEALVSMNPKHSIPHLIDAVAATDARISGDASWTLIRVGRRAQSQLPLLIKSLGSRDNKTRIVAAEVLGTLGSEARSATPDLERMLKSDETDVQLAAADALGRIVDTHSKALKVALEIAGKRESDFQFQAVSSLGSLGRDSEVAVTTLIRLLKHESPSIRYAAATTLGEIGPAAKLAISALKNVEEDGLFQAHAAASYAVVKLEGDEN